MAKINKTNITSFNRRVRSFGVTIAVCNLLLTFNRFVPARLLTKLSRVRTSRVQRILEPFLSSNLPEYDCKNSGNDNAIWVCWLQGEERMPSLVKVCLASIRRFANGHKVVLLTEDNYQDYVTLNRNVIDKYKSGRIKPAHFADIMRVNLLAQQGGLWLDATMMLTAPLTEEIFSRQFFSIKIKPYGNFVSQCRWSVFCIGAHRGNEIMVRVAKAFDNYLDKHDVFVDYFMFDQLIDMCCRNESMNKMIQEVPYNNLQLYGLTPILCDDYDEQKFAELTSDTSMFKLNWKKYTDEQLLANPNSYFAQLQDFIR